MEYFLRMPTVSMICMTPTLCNFRAKDSDFGYFDSMFQTPEKL